MDIMLISETRFINNDYFKVNGYNTYHTQLASGRAHDRSDIIIKSNIKNYELPP